ncbi:prepilin-type N-terminal cleavage/methylation domain-containing protein [Oleiharenicola lentus]|uniref:prepilin-type N-terminal cleavage/methylation domain-containing protein n=1 Tax=Oleiharenicola lentus TaxID=2508720 RepID=UPI003F66BECE
MKLRSQFPVRARGFSLVEVLVSLVMLAALLLAINQFVFSIAESWAKDRERFTFTQHTRAVSRHIGEMFEASANSARASGLTQGGLIPGEIKVPRGGNVDLMTFDLPNGDRLFSWPGSPLPEVQCAIGWEREAGLVIYYKSRLEEDFDTADFRVATLSSFVTEISYDYYDADRNTWTVETGLKKTATALTPPRRIKLRFQRGNQDITEVVDIPLLSGEGVPAY